MKFAVVVSTMIVAAVPAAAHAEDYEGPYVGVEGGIGILNTDGTTIAGPFETSDTSAFFGGLAGLRTHVSGDAGLVVGVEGDLGVYTVGGDIRYGVSAIGGFEPAKGTLLYGRIGYAGRDGFPTGAGDGLMFGGGVETALSDSINIRLDYKHLDLGEIDIPDNSADYSGHEVTAGVVFGF